MKGPAATAPKPGLVYVLYNSSMPALVKIGRTSRSSEARARQLRTTGVAEHFVVLWDEYVSDTALVERAVHERLGDHRQTPDREFFRVSPKKAIATLIDVAAAYRLGSPAAGEVVTIFSDLSLKYPGILRSELTGVAVVVDDSSVLLRTTETDSRGRTTTDTDLGFIWDGENPRFSVAESARTNAERFLSLDLYSLIMTTDLIQERDALRIAQEIEAEHQR